MKATRDIVGGAGLFLVVGWMMGGCAGSTTASSEGGEGGSDPGPSSSSAGGAGGVGMGGAGMGGAGGAGGSGGAGGAGTGGSGGSSGSMFYPLAPGATWTYDVTPVNGGAVCDPGTHTTSIVSTSMVAGRTAFEVDSFCTGIAQTFFLSSQAEQVDILESGAWALYLPDPQKNGQTWMTPTASYTWYFEGSVTVPAGSFSDCWKAQENFIEGDSYTIYCRGVGPVRAYLAGGIVGSGYDAILTSTSFVP